MNIQNAISDLLYLHDCVIIPGFGGFVTRYQPATIHPTQHQFTAPCKAILFNRNLRSDDGLLTDHLARISGSSYQEASLVVGKIVKDFEAQLSSGKRVQIQSVGELYLDVERSVQFTPDRLSNFLLDSFGLAEFQSSPVKRYEDMPRVVQMPSAIASVKKRSSVKKFLAAAVILPFVAALGYLPFHTSITSQSLSSLNPFSGIDGPKGTYTPRNHEVKEIHLREVAFNHTLPVASTDFVPSEVKVEAVPEVLAAVNVEHASSSAVVKGKFMLIAGCFQNEENAQNFIAQLTEKGLQASLAGNTPNGLIRVSCGSFNDRSTAVSMQNDLKAKSTSTWILAD